MTHVRATWRFGIGAGSSLPASAIRNGLDERMGWLIAICLCCCCFFLTFFSLSFLFVFAAAGEHELSSLDPLQECDRSYLLDGVDCLRALAARRLEQLYADEDGHMAFGLQLDDNAMFE